MISNLGKKSWLLIILSLSIVYAGCAATRKNQEAVKMKDHPANMPRSHFGMPANAPHLGSAPPASKPFQPAKKMESPYKKVVISVINKKNNETRHIEVSVGGDKVALGLGGEDMMIRALEFYSDFVIGPTGPVSRSESLNNPAVRVIITQGKETIYEGYLFGKFPDTHSFEHEEVKLKLVDALKK